MVHASGKVRVIEDTVWLRSQLEALTAHNEAPFPMAWTVADAPYEFTEKLIGQIIGFETVNKLVRQVQN